MASKISSISSNGKQDKVKNPIVEYAKLSIPEAIYSFICKSPEFQWFFEDDKAHDEFAKLNPQFIPANRIKYTLPQILKIPLNNRNNWTFDSVFGARKNK